MTAATDEIQDLDPHHNLGPFSRSPVVRCFLIATLVHIALIGATSLGYIYKLIDPLGALKAEQEDAERVKAEKEARDQKLRAEAEAAAKAAAASAAAQQPPATEAKPATDPKQPDPEQVKNPEYLKNLNQSEKPPTEPPDFDLN